MKNTVKNRVMTVLEHAQKQRNYYYRLTLKEEDDNLREAYGKACDQAETICELLEAILNIKDDAELDRAFRCII